MIGLKTLKLWKMWPELVANLTWNWVCIYSLYCTAYSNVILYCPCERY